MTALVAATAWVIAAATPLDAAATSTWRTAATPAPASSEEETLGVACAGSTVCWAVGQYLDNGGPWHVDIEQNSGSVR